jgi:hypothetical protein
MINEKIKIKNEIKIKNIHFKIITKKILINMNYPANPQSGLYIPLDLIIFIFKIIFSFN